MRAEYAEIPHFKEFFDLVADDFISMEELEEFAAGPSESLEAVAEPWSDFLVERLKQVRERENRPAIRAHIGIAAPTIEPTVEGIKKLAEAEAFEIVLPGPGSDFPGTAGEVYPGRRGPQRRSRPAKAVPCPSAPSRICADSRRPASG